MVNFPMNEQFKGMSTYELEEYVEGAKAELARRKNERANKLIQKVCVDLNELRELGVTFIVEDMEGYDVFVFDNDTPITSANFKIPEVK